MLILFTISADKLNMFVCVYLEKQGFYNVEISKEVCSIWRGFVMRSSALWPYTSVMTERCWTSRWMVLTIFPRTDMVMFLFIWILRISISSFFTNPFSLIVSKSTEFSTDINFSPQIHSSSSFCIHCMFSYFEIISPLACT